MKRIIVWLLVVAFALVTLISGCRDETDPEYWLDAMYDRPWREKALKTINEIFNSAMQENDNDIEHPEVKKLVDLMVPELINGFNEFTRDKFNRTEIIKILAQMNDARSVPVFMQGLALEETSDSMMFQVSANAIRRQGVEEALPKLIEAHDLIVAARSKRPESPFTHSENEIEQAVISAVSQIAVKYPNTAQKDRIVEVLCQISETPDTLQELRLNMKAMKGLGRIGDPKSISTLIKGIAMKGKRQPIGLGPIATSALMQIHDRDAVVDGILAFARGKDESFNEYYQQERKNDPLMKNPTWYIQESTTFLGKMRHKSPKVIAFLTEELNHTEPDETDEAASKIEGLPVNFEPDGWATMRRNWSAVALASLAHKPLLDVIKERMVFKKERKRNILQLQAEEAVGYVRSLGLLLYPKESCQLLKSVGRAGDDSLRDKCFYNASLMCGKEFLRDMKKAHDKIDCDDVVVQRFPDGASEDDEKQARNECDIMKKRIVGYMDRIKYGEECGLDVDCYVKTLADHGNSNVERSILTLYRIARDDPSKKQAVVEALTTNLNNPSKLALNAAVFVLDQLTPEGDPELVKRIQDVYREFASQSTYKDRARALQSFIGRVRARGGG